MQLTSNRRYATTLGVIIALRPMLRLRFRSSADGSGTHIMGSVKRFFRYLWAGPATLLGLVVAFALIRRGRVACVDGVVEAHGPLLERALATLTPLAQGADALTLGHVVLGRNARALEVTRTHERVHVRQYESWGAFFLPAYFLAGAWALATGRHPYFDNRFELEARQVEMQRNS